MDKLMKEKMLEDIIERLHMVGKDKEENEENEEMGEGALDPSPEHEALETPEMEAKEHETGVEAQDEAESDEDKKKGMTIALMFGKGKK